MSLSKLPIITLEKIVKSLDLKSCENLVKAAEKSDLENRLKLLQRSRKLMCPYCINESSFNYIYEMYEKHHNHCTDDGKIKKSDFYIACMKTFSAFVWFQASDEGNENYERVKDECDSKYFLRNRFNVLDEYKRITFSMHNNQHKNRWSCDLIVLLEKMDVEKDLYDLMKEHVGRSFFGGDTCFGFVNNQLQSFTKEELIEHIDEEHYSTRVQAARIKSRAKWYTKIHKDGIIDIPRELFFGEEVLDIGDFQEWLMDMVVARYLMNEEKSDNLVPNSLLSERHFMWCEIKKIYKLVKSTFNDARYPFIPQNNCKDVNLYKMIDVINMALEKIVK